MKTKNKIYLFQTKISLYINENQLFGEVKYKRCSKDKS